MQARTQIALFVTAALMISSPCHAAHAANAAGLSQAGDPPNIVVILADDLGIGDPRCYNPDSRIPTPFLDNFAAQGMRFTDAHAPAAVCTPTRYALLTGRYAWRTRLKSGVLWNGYARTLIEEDRETIASMLKRHGYHTGCVGKWHLGLDWQSRDGSLITANEHKQIDFTLPITRGPEDVGFDYSFVHPASLDMPPYCWVENGRAVEEPTVRDPGSERVWSGGGGFWRAGLRSPSFAFNEVLPTIADRSVAYIQDRAATGQPFFLYVPLASPHTPWVPNEPHKGMSDAGAYGDFVHETDRAIGQILQALRANGLAERTLVVVASDNGSHWPSKQIEKYEHRANHIYRGQKADIHEGGHRIPFLVRWPGIVPPDSRSTALVGLNDLYATFADVVGEPDDPGQAEDSVSFVDVLDGRSEGVREDLVLHSVDGMFAIRRGDWKYIEGRGSGGFTQPKRVQPQEGEPAGQLYDLGADPSEEQNLYAAHTDLVDHLQTRLDDCRTARASQMRRPNILFVFTDDHAAQSISAYGSRINVTPNIDRIANEGMLFRNCFVTNSICAPSRATILTGKFSHLNGVITNVESFDGAQQTFPKLLQQAGYQTAMIGKWHLKSDPTGFDHWQVLIGQGPYYNPPIKSEAGRTPHTGYTTEILTDMALDWLEEGRDANKPFMLMLQHKAPHRNWQPGPEYLTLYDDVTIPEPDTLFDDYEGRRSGARDQEMTIARHFFPSDVKLEPPGNLTEEQLAAWNEAYEPKNDAFRIADLQGEDLVRWRYQRYLKDYLRTIAAVDDNVGRVLDYLDESGLADNTIVVYSSDQGFYLGEHGWYDKRWMYEESLRMPLLVRWPDHVAPGSSSSALVQNLDFAPTFLSMAGADVPDDMQGRNMLPILRGDTPRDWRQSVYYHYYEFPGVHAVPRHYGVRSDRYKLIHYYQLNEWELFDLHKDPNELKSVYADPAYVDVIAMLKRELTRLQAEYRDATPHAPRGFFAQQPLRRQAANVDLELALRLPTIDDPVIADLDPSAKPIAVGAFCKPDALDGVLFAQGGGQYGYVLFLVDGRPTLGVRSGGEYAEVAATRSLQRGEWAHVAGTLAADGVLRVFVNGEEWGRAPGLLLARKPGEGFDLGRDTGDAVGRYDGGNPLGGDLRDVRIYWGELDAATLNEWRNQRPETP